MIWRQFFGRAEGSAQPEPLASEEAAIWEMLQANRVCEKGHEVSGKPMDLCADAPDPWSGPRNPEPNSALRLDEQCLTEDFCVLQGPSQTNYLVRAVIRFPIAETDEDWGFGCWSTLSRENFDKYIDGFDAGVYPDEEPWFGWLCNRLIPVYPGPDPLPVAVCPQQDRQRPLLVVRDDDHPLAIFQDEGLPPSVLLDILQAYGLGPQVN